MLRHMRGRGTSFFTEAPYLRSSIASPEKLILSEAEITKAAVTAVPPLFCYRVFITRTSYSVTRGQEDFTRFFVAA